MNCEFIMLMANSKTAPDSDMKMVENILLKYCSYIESAVQAMKKYDKKQELVDWLSKLNNMMSKSWDVPSFGQEMSDILSNILRKNGGLDLLIDQCNVENEEVAFRWEIENFQLCMVGCNFPVHSIQTVILF